MLIIVILALSILIIVKPAFAQSVPSLSAPTFTVTLTNTSYSVPTTYYADPQTGANLSKAGFFVNQENLTFTIQNQPDATYYVIRWTTPYMNNWNQIEGFISGDPMNATVQRTSGSTTKWALIGNNNTWPIYENGSVVTTVDGYSFPFGFTELDFESGANIEFQVQASSGSPRYVSTILSEHFSVVGEISDWSNTQTITIPETSTTTSPTPNPTPTPTVQEFPSWASLLVLTSMVAAAGFAGLPQKTQTQYLCQSIPVLPL